MYRFDDSDSTKAVFSDMGSMGFSGIEASSEAPVMVEVCSKEGLSKEDALGMVEMAKAARRLQGEPSVLEILDALQTPKSYYFVWKGSEGGVRDLFSCIEENESLSEDQSRSIMGTVLAAVRSCHELGILHRNIKPEAIMVMSQDTLTDCRVGGFGLCDTGYTPGQRKKRQPAGTPG